MDVETLLPVDMSAQENTTKKSAIPHLDLGLGLVGSSTIGKGNVVYYYNGSLVYANLAKNPRKMKKNGEEVMQKTAERFGSGEMSYSKRYLKQPDFEKDVDSVSNLFCLLVHQRLQLLSGTDYFEN